MDPIFRPIITGLRFGEGIRVHDGTLWLSDMHDRKVLHTELDGTPIRVYDTPDRPSGIVPCADGVLVTQMHSRSVVHLAADGRITPHADLSAVAEWHVNDMCAGPSGSLFVGNFGDASAPPTPPHPADLAHIAADGTVSRAASGMHFANGMVLVDDPARLLVAETRSDPPMITQFDVRADGVLTNRRAFARFSGAYMPDGLALAGQGRVLVAMPFAQALVLLDADGAQLAEFSTAGLGMPYACAVDIESSTAFACVASAWQEEETARARDGQVLAFALD